jgi:hypothetical protein
MRARPFPSSLLSLPSRLDPLRPDRVEPLDERAAQHAKRTAAGVNER